MLTMPAIEVTNLQKTFQTKRKTAGMGGSMRAESPGPGQGSTFSFTLPLRS